MLRFLALASLLGMAALAGCLDGDDDADADTPPMPGTAGQPGYLHDGPGSLFAGPALYEDPQNTPHPAFNWPTLSHPAVGPDVPRWWKPIPEKALPAAVTGLQHVTQASGIPQAAGIAIFGSLLVVPSYSTDLPSAVLDISDPSDPKVLGEFTTQLGPHRGATIIAYPTGRLVTVISTGGGLDVWDITDPTQPQPLPPIEVSSHKVGVLPGTPIVFNAASGGGGTTGASNVGALATSTTKMWDFSDPEDPVELPDFANGYGCHHIYFWNNLTQEKFRSICAGIQYTQIIDTTDPYHPSVITSVPFGSGGLGQDQVALAQVSFSHYAGLSVDGTILLVGDEHGGGAGPIGCAARVDTPLGAVSVPIGAVWFYDVSDETDPVLLGWVSASQLEKAGVEGAQASCTAHHGRLLPTPGRDVLAMSFYGAGVILVDFTGVRGETPALPVVIDQFADNSDTWETWYYAGYLFTGDLLRGVDVLTLE